MSESVEIDLRRVILQSLESWNAAGITHLTATALPAEPAVAVPAREAPRMAPVASAPVTSAKETQANLIPAALESSGQVRTSNSSDSETGPGPSATERSAGISTASSTESNSPMAKKTGGAKAGNLLDRSEPPSTAPATGPVFQNLSLADRINELQILSQQVAKCTRCPELAATRTQTVFGVGNPQARVVFIGEAPGADEDAQGEPFVGRAGQLLNKIIEAMKLKREEIYICNILRCRPPGNRLPEPQEASCCREYLDGQLGIINPEYIVCWGSCASQNLLGVTDSIGKMRGRFFAYGRAKVLCTYHPSYLLRNPPAKKDVWEDMKILMKELGIPVE